MERSEVYSPPASKPAAPLESFILLLRGICTTVEQRASQQAGIVLADQKPVIFYCYLVAEISAACINQSLLPFGAGQVTFIKQRPYFTSITGKRNQLLLIRYSFFTVLVPLQLIVTTKSKQLRSGTVTPSHFISGGHQQFILNNS